jgi:Lipase (class 3)
MNWSSRLGYSQSGIERQQQVVQPTQSLNLSDKIVRLSQRAAELSILTFDVGTPTENEHGSKYEYYQSFINEPDAAIVAGIEGYCFAAFRGTIGTIADWYQNIQSGLTPICKNDTTVNDTTCCSVRSGYDDAYNSPFRQDLEDALTDCVDVYGSSSSSGTSTSLCNQTAGMISPCVVLTGFSQGAAVAAVSALYLYQFNPYVISFGQPLTLANDIESPGCFNDTSFIQTNRWYRYVNTYNTAYGLRSKIGYDIVSMLPAFGAQHRGHMIVFPPTIRSTVVNMTDSSHTTNSTTMIVPLSEGIAYVGLDESSMTLLHPASLLAHSMVDTANDTSHYHPGYLDHLNAILFSMDSSNFVIADGYIDSTLCTEHRECQSNSCRRIWKWSSNVATWYRKRCILQE